MTSIKRQRPLAEGVNEVNVLSQLKGYGFPLLMHYEVGSQFVDMEIYQDHMVALADTHLKVEEVKMVFVNSVLTLEQIHQQGISLRSISPQTILIDQRLSVRFDDFTHCNETVAVDRYTSPEEVLEPNEVSPVCDIYALCRSFYDCFEKVLGQLPADLLAAIEAGMILEPQKRQNTFQNIMIQLKSA